MTEKNVKRNCRDIVMDTKFMEDREPVVFLRKTDVESKERDHKLQSHRADISDVEVVCILHCSPSGERERTRVLEENTCWRN